MQQSVDRMWPMRKLPTMKSRPPTVLVVLVLIAFVTIAGTGMALTASGDAPVGDAVFAAGILIAPAWYFWTRARYFR
jgi:hypothetical protein